MNYPKEIKITAWHCGKHTHSTKELAEKCIAKTPKRSLEQIRADSKRESISTVKQVFAGKSYTELAKEKGVSIESIRRRIIKFQRRARTRVFCGEGFEELKENRPEWLWNHKQKSLLGNKSEWQNILEALDE